jgi:hypothetical protein
MSKIAIQGNDQGTGTLTFSAPDTNNDRTLTLPDETGTILTSGTPLSSFPSGFANGITQADIWRLTTDKSLSAGSSSDITANLERSDDVTRGLIGSGMSESSGIFTFPETGIYLVTATGVFLRDSNGSRFISLDMLVSSNSGSNYDTVANARSGITKASTSTENFGAGTASALVDVTNASTFRIKFSAFSTEASTVSGESNGNLTHFVFIRIGDT